MTLLSDIAARVMTERPGMKKKYDELPERRRKHVLGRGLTHFSHLIDVQHEEHCQQTKMGRKRS